MSTKWLNWKPAKVMVIWKWFHVAAIKKCLITYVFSERERKKCPDANSFIGTIKATSNNRSY
jgi:hypothetical protein